MPPASKRQLKLYAELRDALSRTSSQDLSRWGQRSAARLPAIGARRVRTLGATIANRAAGESSAPVAIPPSRDAVLLDHFASRSADAVDHSLGIYNGAARMFDEVRQCLIRDPRSMVPALFALALGFHARSGTASEPRPAAEDYRRESEASHGVVFTRSIVSGTVIELAVLAIADLADLVRANLLGRHDGFWDQLAARRRELAARLAAGASPGMSYHLAVDATLHPIPHADFPVAMPIEALQHFMGPDAGDPLREELPRRRRLGAPMSWRTWRSARRGAQPAQKRARRAPS
jgi:hypothetical protein